MIQHLSLRKIWDKAKTMPKGKEMVAKTIGMLAPYTGNLNIKILDLNNMNCRVQLKDRRSVRNHLKSIHAAALMNFSESASGLLLMYSLPDTHRAILVKFDIEYIKKARGIITAECELPKRLTFDKEEKLVLTSLVRNSDGDVVAKANAHWLVSPK